MTTVDWDLNANSFAADILVKHLLSLQAEIEGVRINKDVEPVHRMRVASRRLRNALETFRFCFHDHYLNSFIKSIKKVTTSLGQARDLDVQILCAQKILIDAPDPKYYTGIKRVILRLKQKRASLQNRVVKSIDTLTGHSNLEHFSQGLSPMHLPDSSIPVYSMPIYRLAWEVIFSQLQAFLSYEIFISDIENTEQHHAMRIAAKKLRYSLEIFSPLYPDELKPYLEATRYSQDQLGMLHDCVVWQSYLSSFLEKEKKRTIRFYGNGRGLHAVEVGIHYLEQNRLDERSSCYNAFCSAWDGWKNSGLWQELVNTLKAPILS